jgi:hypothetical protein
MNANVAALLFMADRYHERLLRMAEQERDGATHETSRRYWEGHVDSDSMWLGSWRATWSMLVHG